MLSALAIASGMMFYYSFAIPFMRIGEQSRVAAEKINANLPQGVVLKMLNVGLGEPFIFYLKNHHVALTTSQELLEDQTGFVLVASKTLAELENGGHLPQGSLRNITELKTTDLERSKQGYSLIEFKN